MTRGAAAAMVIGAALATVSLTGCNRKPEIEACETFVREKVATPSTIKVITASSVPAIAKNIYGLKPTDQVTLVSIEYDAENQYGAPIRSSAYCAFPMKNGELPSLREMRSQASASAIWAKLHANGPLYTDLDTIDLIEKADALDRGERIYACCIPERKD